MRSIEQNKHFSNYCILFLSFNKMWALYLLGGWGMWKHQSLGAAQLLTRCQNYPLINTCSTCQLLRSVLNPGSEYLSIHFSRVSTTLNARSNNDIILIIALENIILQIVAEINSSQDSAKFLMQTSSLIAAYLHPTPRKLTTVYWAFDMKEIKLPTWLSLKLLWAII